MGPEVCKTRKNKEKAHRNFPALWIWGVGPHVFILLIFELNIYLMYSLVCMIYFTIKKGRSVLCQSEKNEQQWY